MLNVSLYGRSELDLHGLGLIEIPEEAYALTEITSLIARKNGLECTSTNLYGSISPKLTSFSALTILDLGWNRLKVLPPCIFELPLLESLIVNNNELEELDARIGTFANTLKTLHLGVNRLKELPDEIGKLKALNSLIAPNNRLSALPASICNLEALVDIYLRYNQFTSLPRALFGIPTLTIVSVEDNRIVSLPDPSELPRSSIIIHHSVPQEILPHIYIGSSSSSRNRSSLEQLHLTHHLALIDAIGDSHSAESSSISDHTFSDRLLMVLNDTEAQNIEDAISRANAFIERAIRDGGNVLVNSTLGTSRSAAIICAYMIKTLKIGFDEAIARIRSVRASAKPNAGFEKQLRFYEQSIKQ